MIQNTKFFRFDGKSFETVASSKCDHRKTYGLANYRGSPLTTGSSNPSDCYIRTEVYNFGTQQWHDAPDYPFAWIQIGGYSVASTDAAAFVIGGVDAMGYYSNVIAKFENEEWSLYGYLRLTRGYHKSITYGTETIVIGGESDDDDSDATPKFSEIWDFSNGDNRTVVQGLNLRDTRGLYLVAADFLFFCR